jgi:hypothetical protein
MTHLTRAELESWHRTAIEADRDRIVGHLAVCDACAATYAAIVRAHVDEEPSHFDTRDFREAGYGALAPAPRRRFFFRPGLLVPLAAAAAILLAIWVPSLRPADDSDETPSRVLRGAATPQAIAPSGDVEGAIEFRWTAAAGADRYAIEVKDHTGRRVFYRETRDERLAAADAALLAALARGGSFTWTVATLDGAGEILAQSTPRSFTRRPQ